ncbi:MarR family winged helix-turn-helix transcriptional regulator [Chitinimonas naiadis]
MPTSYYSIENYGMDESIGFLITQVQLRLHDALNQELAPTGISWPQWKVLMQVYYKRAGTAADLARCTASDTGSMTRMIDRLEEKGFLRRVRSETDRRLVRLELTEAGRALMPTMVQAVVDVLNSQLEGFEPEELELFKSFMRRMIATADSRKTN